MIESHVETHLGHSGAPVQGHTACPGHPLKRNYPGLSQNLVPGRDGWRWLLPRHILSAQGGVDVSEGVVERLAWEAGLLQPGPTGKHFSWS